MVIVSECAECAVIEACECGNEVAKTSANSHNVTDLSLTELPLLVVEEILKNLDTSAKLSLRLTCKAWKRWVDVDGNFLKLFQPQISSEKELQSFLEGYGMFPECVWKSVEFEKKFTGYQLFPEFVEYFGYGNLCTLHIHRFDVDNWNLLSFVEGLTNLENLRIDEMHLPIESSSSSDSQIPVAPHRLRKFYLGQIYFQDTGGFQLGFYCKFLQRCENLEKVNVPMPKVKVQDHCQESIFKWDALKMLQLKWLVEPILEFLSKQSGKPRQVQVEVEVDVEHLFSRHFPVFAKIGATLCVSFWNVNEKHVKYLHHGEENSEEILQQIVTLREKIDDRRPLEIWTNLEELRVRSQRCDIRLEYPENSGNFFLPYPKLRDLWLIMDSRSREDPGFQMLGRLLKVA